MQAREASARRSDHLKSGLQEDVQVIGLSILSGAHNAIVPRVMDLLRAGRGCSLDSRKTIWAADERR